MRVNTHSPRRVLTGAVRGRYSGYLERLVEGKAKGPPWMVQSGPF